VVAAWVAGVDTRRKMSAPPATHDDEPDEALMLAYARGNTSAFERLYSRHRGGTYRYLLRHTGNAASAEELHQDVWLKVVRARDGYAPEARFTTWLYTVARHRLVDHWRSRRGFRLASLDDEGVEAAVEDSSPDGPAAADPLSATIDAQAGQRLITALSDVPPAQRDAFLLHVEGGLSLSEIAALTGASVETVKSRLRYAYRKLRAALGDLQ
jgi:RNA polymerase sigma-70 factor (ECF subfamily)